MIAMAATSAAAVLGWPLWVAMLLLPIIVQASFAGPTMLRRYARMAGGRGPFEAAGGLAVGTSLLLRPGRLSG